jgi:hypothetical protein
MAMLAPVRRSLLRMVGESCLKNLSGAETLAYGEGSDLYRA